MTSQRLTIGYVSMEIGLESAMPTYSGGMLAGDTIRPAARTNRGPCRRGKFWRYS